MSRHPNPLQPRLPESLPPGFDRSATVTITFDGRPITAYAVDTVASAMLGAGIQLVSRSFKYHRPRGLRVHERHREWNRMRVIRVVRA